jgi:broad specificity phosphatase PhoE
MKIINILMLKIKPNKNALDLIKRTRNLINNPQTKNLILIRSCENIGSLSGCLNGWLDAKLSEYGRKQAKYISIEYFSNFDFKNVFVSDLLRAKETAEICMGYDYKVNYNTVPELREVYFGQKEGLFYDGLSPEDKKELSKKSNKFKGGESWLDVKYRSIKFLNYLNTDNNLEVVFSHGGFIASLLQSKGITTLPPNGSVIIASLSNYYKNKDECEYKSLLNEFSKQYNCADSSYNEVFFNRYNGAFEDYLDKSVENINFIYHLPDLSEEMI